MWPENSVSRVPEVEHHETLFDIFSPKKSEFKCFKLVYILQCKCCSSNEYCFCNLLRCGLRSVCPESLEDFNTSMLSLKFYSASSLYTACILCTVLKQVLFSYLLKCGLRTKFSESWEDIALTALIWNFTQCSLNFTAFLTCL